MSTFFSMEPLLQCLFLRTLNEHELFEDEQSRHVHVHSIGRDPAGQEQYTLQLFVGGTHCQASGAYTGDEEGGVIRLDWAQTPLSLKPISYGMRHHFRHHQPVHHEEAVALAT